LGQVLIDIQKMFLMIRHGERADRAHNHAERSRIKIEFDPHLTKNGHLMACRTAELLTKELAQQVEAKTLCPDYELVFISSPFLRCLQTAAEIMRRTEKKRHSGILRVEESITEWLNSKWFPSKTAIDELSIHRMTAEQKKKAFEGVEIKRNELFDGLGLKRPQIGEDTMEKALERIEQFYQRFLEGFLSKEYQRPAKRVYVLVTHGFAISGLYELASGIKSFKKYGWVDYCSTNLLFLDRSPGKALPVSLHPKLTNYLDHISDLLSDF
jgi:broad specificity phosphatase PhoE